MVPEVNLHEAQKNPNTRLTHLATQIAYSITLLVTSHFISDAGRMKVTGVRIKGIVSCVCYLQL